MRHVLLVLLFLIFSPLHAQSQASVVLAYPGTPKSGDCRGELNNWVAANVVTGTFWYCDGSSWALLPNSGLMIYPSVGVPSSTGISWGSSYVVGTSANNLVQLDAGGALPAVSAANLTNFPTLNQNTNGNAATATALASTPVLCSSGNAPTGITANGNAIGCSSITGGSVQFLSADASPGSTSNTLGSTGMTFSVSANTTYTLECHLDMQVSTTSGVGLTLGVIGPGSPTKVTLAMENWTSQTARRSEWSQGTSWGAKLGATATTYSTNPLPVTLTGLIENGTTSGTLTVEYANIGTTGTTTLKRGSWCKLQ